MDDFSAWELASATWLLALIGLCFYFKAIREAALAVIKVIFRGRLRQWALLMVAYVILVCFA
ncbi:hypothetical protein QEH52_00315 [Coraliomargarita sp. SDUM461003]|uniref:Uncharacterized protein n=1 Tax=Thalassobacterium maritimum TaxID=3041265 RepID=A0ABU1AQN1_9BACT|nr:hypothetical protein [Coraliomargarita sp. SDUM461003]MDQ8205937.1 hypothetical protein [Coraliomargarita sp. SDUM461003]